MRGRETIWLPGTDHAGIATQTRVERMLLETEGRRRTDYPRDEFVAIVQRWKDDYERHITDQLEAARLAPADWDRQRFTMDEVCARAVREAFFRLFRERPDLPGQAPRQLGPRHAHGARRRRGRDARGGRRVLLPPLPAGARRGPRRRAPRDVVRAARLRLPARAPAARRGRGRRGPGVSSPSPPRGPRRTSATPPSPSTRTTRAPAPSTASSPSSRWSGARSRSSATTTSSCPTP